MEQNKYIPQVKICGLKDVDQAIECVNLGVKAIGFIFYPKSPRNINDETAKKISQALPQNIVTVGVFVNESFSYIIDKVKNCNLKGVQLHGLENPDLVSSLKKEKLIVIKGLFIAENPSLDKACDYNASAYLIELGKGPLPGGNAKAWDFKQAKNFSYKYPLILAGGLSPENIFEAVNSCLPDAVDVSSGVEDSPGRKNLSKVKSFMNALQSVSLSKELRRIF
ncbi:MAG: phosphoribosylanthranilate isomerase [Desulfobacterales bacterium]|nr:phosphoribosylanthranilate isomerase [Desulfobacterales bacterium]MBF0396529.1 phosphoribosylanthranilate isomerase [Desulfobacterales bacterium]